MSLLQRCRVWRLVHCASRDSAISEFRNRRHRLILELLRAGCWSRTVVERRQHFPGAIALLSAHECMHRTHDIPSFDHRRPSTMMKYLTGVSEPLLPLGLPPSSPTARRGGTCTSVLVTIPPHDARSVTPAAGSSSDACFVIPCTVTVFVPTEPIEELVAWHDDAPGAPLSALRLFSGVASPQALPFLLHLTSATQTHDACHRCARVVLQCSEMLASNLTVNVIDELDGVLTRFALQNASSSSSSSSSTVATALPNTPAKLPYVFVSLPEQRRLCSTNVGDAAVFLTSVRACASQRRHSPANTPVNNSSLETASVVADATSSTPRGLTLTHPVSAVLTSLLSFQLRTVASSPDRTLFPRTAKEGRNAPVETQEPTSSPTLVEASCVATQMWQFSFSGAPDWGLPAAFPVADRSGACSSVRRCTVHLLDPILNAVRAFKSPQDGAEFLYSAFVTRSLFLSAMRHGSTATVANTTESQLLVALQQPLQDSLVNCALSDSGCHDAHNVVDVERSATLAYPPVVAAGRNSCRVHHTCLSRNAVDPTDWVLVDAGAEVDDIFPTDCTRTWRIRCEPILVKSEGSALSGESSRMETFRWRLYDAVLATQRSLIQTIRAWTPRDVLRQRARLLLSQDLSLLLCGSGAVSDRLLDVVTAHSVGHFVGFDIHERCGFFTEEGGGDGDLLWLPGMMHTVEPGLYLRSPDDPALSRILASHGVPREEYVRALGGSIPTWKPSPFPFGVRVEDTILVLPRVEDDHVDGDAGPSARPAHRWSRRQYLNALLRTYAVHLLRDVALFSESPLTHGGERDEQGSGALLLPSGVSVPQAYVDTLLRRADQAPRSSSCSDDYDDDDSDWKAAVRWVFIAEQALSILGKPYCDSGALSSLVDPLVGASSTDHGRTFHRPGGGDSPFCWYPFDVVVTTACVPKDRSAIVAAQRWKRKRDGSRYDPTVF